MACDFNATTSVLSNTTAAHNVSTLRTLLVWMFADGIGEGNAGQILALDEAALKDSLFMGSTTTIKYVAARGTTSGEWSAPVALTTWNAIALSYDKGSVANNPVVRVNFVDKTVTTVITPVGSADNPASGILIGNNDSSARTFDGMIAHVMVHNVILTPGECDQQLRRPGSVRRGLQLWYPLLNALHLSNWSGTGAFTLAATAVADRVGGPPCSPLYAGWNFSAISQLILPPSGGGQLLMGVG